MRGATSLTRAAVIGSIAYSLHLVDERAAILAFVSTAPWLLICHPKTGPGLRALAVFLGMIYAIGLASLPWLIKISVGGWLIVPMFYVVLFVPMFALSRALFALWPQAPLSLLWPLAFVAGEWIRMSTSPGEVPFGQLAQALVAYPRLAQSVDIGGAWILSGLAGSTGGLIASVLHPSLTGSRRNVLMLVREAALPIIVLVSCLAYGGDTTSSGALRCRSSCPACAAQHARLARSGTSRGAHNGHRSDERSRHRRGASRYDRVA